MKKGWRRFWIICGSLFGVGVVLILIAAVFGMSKTAVEESHVGQMIRNNIFSKDIYTYTQDEEADDSEDSSLQTDDVQTYQGIRQLDVDVSAGTIEIRRTKDSEVKVETSGMKLSYGFKQRQDGDTLELSMKKKVSTKNNKSKIIVYLPENLELQEVSMELGAGVLYIEDIAAGELDIDLGAGQATVDRFKAGDLEVSCGAGEVTMTGEVETGADLECGTGQITYHAKGAEEDYNYDAKSGIGDITIGSNSISGLGKEKFINNDAYKTISVSCGIGEISIDFEKK